MKEFTRQSRQGREAALLDALRIEEQSSRRTATAVRRCAGPLKAVFLNASGIEALGCIVFSEFSSSLYSNHRRQPRAQCSQTRLFIGPELQVLALLPGSVFPAMLTLSRSIPSPPPSTTPICRSILSLTCQDVTGEPHLAVRETKVILRRPVT